MIDGPNGVMMGVPVRPVPSNPPPPPSAADVSSAQSALRGQLKDLPPNDAAALQAAIEQIERTNAAISREALARAAILLQAQVDAAHAAQTDTHVDPIEQAASEVGLTHVFDYSTLDAATKSLTDQPLATSAADTKSPIDADAARTAIQQGLDGGMTLAEAVNAARVQFGGDERNEVSLDEAATAIEGDAAAKTEAGHTDFDPLQAATQQVDGLGIFAKPVQEAALKALTVKVDPSAGLDAAATQAQNAYRTYQTDKANHATDAQLARDDAAYHQALSTELDAAAGQSNGNWRGDLLQIDRRWQAEQTVVKLNTAKGVAGAPKADDLLVSLKAAQIVDAVAAARGGGANGNINAAQTLTRQLAGAPTCSALDQEVSDDQRIVYLRAAALADITGARGKSAQDTLDAEGAALSKYRGTALFDPLLHDTLAASTTQQNMQAVGTPGNLSDIADLLEGTAKASPELAKALYAKLQDKIVSLVGDGPEYMFAGTETMRQRDSYYGPLARIVDAVGGPQSTVVQPLVGALKTKLQALLSELNRENAAHEDTLANAFQPLAYLSNSQLNDPTALYQSLIDQSPDSDLGKTLAKYTSLKPNAAPVTPAADGAGTLATAESALSPQLKTGQSDAAALEKALAAVRKANPSIDDRTWAEAMLAQQGQIDAQAINSGKAKAPSDLIAQAASELKQDQLFDARTLDAATNTLQSGQVANGGLTPNIPLADQGGPSAAQYLQSLVSDGMTMKEAIALTRAWLSGSKQSDVVLTQAALTVLGQQNLPSYYKDPTSADPIDLASQQLKALNLIDASTIDKVVNGAPASSTDPAIVGMKQDVKPDTDALSGKNGGGGLVDKVNTAYAAWQDAQSKADKNKNDASDQSAAADALRQYHAALSAALNAAAGKAPTDSAWQSDPLHLDTMWKAQNELELTALAPQIEAAQSAGKDSPEAKALESAFDQWQTGLNALQIVGQVQYAQQAATPSGADASAGDVAGAQMLTYETSGLEQGDPQLYRQVMGDATISQLKVSALNSIIGSAPPSAGGDAASLRARLHTVSTRLQAYQGTMFYAELLDGAANDPSVKQLIGAIHDAVYGQKKDPDKLKTLADILQGTSPDMAALVLHQLFPAGADASGFSTAQLVGWTKSANDLTQISRIYVEGGGAQNADMTALRGALEQMIVGDKEFGSVDYSSRLNTQTIMDEGGAVVWGEGLNLGSLKKQGGQVQLAQDMLDDDPTSDLGIEIARETGIPNLGKPAKPINVGHDGNGALTADTAFVPGSGTVVTAQQHLAGLQWQDGMQVATSYDQFINTLGQANGLKTDYSPTSLADEQALSIGEFALFNVNDVIFDASGHKTTLGDAAQALLQGEGVKKPDGASPVTVASLSGQWWKSRAPSKDDKATSFTLLEGVAADGHMIDVGPADTTARNGYSDWQSHTGFNKGFMLVQPHWVVDASGVVQTGNAYFVDYKPYDHWYDWENLRGDIVTGLTIAGGIAAMITLPETAPLWLMMLSEAADIGFAVSAAAGTVDAVRKLSAPGGTHNWVNWLTLAASAFGGAASGAGLLARTGTMAARLSAGDAAFANAARIIGVSRDASPLALARAELAAPGYRGMRVFDDSWTARLLRARLTGSNAAALRTAAATRGLTSLAGASGFKAAGILAMLTNLGSMAQQGYGLVTSGGQASLGDWLNFFSSAGLMASGAGVSRMHAETEVAQAAHVQAVNEALPQGVRLLRSGEVNISETALIGLDENQAARIAELTGKRQVPDLLQARDAASETGLFGGGGNGDRRAPLTPEEMQQLSDLLPAGASVDPSRTITLGESPEDQVVVRNARLAALASVLLSRTQPSKSTQTGDEPAPSQSNQPTINVDGLAVSAHENPLTVVGFSRSADGRSVQIRLADGSVIDAQALGGARTSANAQPDDILLPNQPDRGQRFEVVADPDTGEYVLMPRIRGGATDDDPWAMGDDAQSPSNAMRPFGGLPRLTRPKARPGERDQLFYSALPVVEDPAALLYVPRKSVAIADEAESENAARTGVDAGGAGPNPSRSPIRRSPENKGPFETGFPVKKSEYPLNQWMATYVNETGLIYTEARKVDTQWVFRPNHERRDATNVITIAPDVHVVSALGTPDALFDLNGRPVTAIMDLRRRLVTPQRLANRLSENFGLEERTYTPGQPIAVLAEYTAGGADSFAQQLANEMHAPVYGLEGSYEDRNWLLHFPDAVSHPVWQPDMNRGLSQPDGAQPIRVKWNLLEQRQSSNLEVFADDDPVKIDTYLAPQGMFVINGNTSELLARGPSQVAESARAAGHTSNAPVMLLTTVPDAQRQPFARALADELGSPVLLMTDDAWAPDGNAVRKNTVTVSRVEGAQNKRVHLDDEGNVTFLDTQQNRGSVVWLNLGPMQRSLDYYEQKRGGMDDVVMHTFEVPRSVLDQIRRNAVHQGDATAPGNEDKPVLGDWLASPDQFGLRWADAMDLQSRIIPGSAKTIEIPPRGTGPVSRGAQASKPAAASNVAKFAASPPTAASSEAPPPRIHPRRDEHGKPVVIEAPTEPSAQSTWHDPAATAVFVPDGAHPDVLGGVPMTAWEPPTTLEGWQNVSGQNPDLVEPAADASVKKAGVVIVEPDGRVWIIESTNHFTGHRTFPKGSVDEGLSLQATAVKEGYEETGLHVELLAYLTDFKTKTGKTKTRYYLARRIGGNPAAMGWETQGMYLVPRGELAGTVRTARDARVVRALFEHEGNATPIESTVGEPAPPETVGLPTRVLSDDEQAFNAQLVGTTIGDDAFELAHETDPAVAVNLVAEDATGPIGAGPVNASTVRVLDLRKGGLPKGSGHQLLACALEQANVRPTGRLVFDDVEHPETVAARDAGVPAAQTPLAGTGMRALSKLGLTPASAHYEASPRGYWNLVIELTHGGGTTMPDASSTVEAPGGFKDPDAIAAEAFHEVASQYDLSPEALEDLQWTSPRDNTTQFFDARQGHVKATTVSDASRHVEATDDTAYYISADIYNLGGLNAAFEDVAEHANVHYQAMAHIADEELSRTGAKVVPMRTGGDELGFVVVGSADDESIASALQSARDRIAGYAKEQGLADIPHPKRKGEKGVGMHFGAAPILPGLSLSDIFTEADLGVNRSKTSGNRSTDEAPSVSEDEGAQNVSALAPPSGPGRQSAPPVEPFAYELRPTTHVTDPAEAAALDYIERACGYGLTPEQARSLVQPVALDDVSGFFDARQASVKSSTVKRTRDYVRSSDGTAYYVSGDIFNLGGLNAAMNDVAEVANAHYRSIVGIVADELAHTGADVIPMRTGGDEVGIVVAGPLDEGALRGALQGAQRRLTAYAEQNGLTDVPHPKREGEYGVGMHLGYAKITEDSTLSEIFTEADKGVNRSKTLQATLAKLQTGRLQSIEPWKDGRTVTLTLDSGATVSARVLGTGARALTLDPADVRLPGGPAQGQHFLLVTDPETGEFFITPVMRGGAVDEEPASEIEPDGQAPEVTLSALEQSSDAQGKARSHLAATAAAPGLDRIASNGSEEDVTANAGRAPGADGVDAEAARGADSSTGGGSGAQASGGPSGAREATLSTQEGQRVAQGEPAPVAGEALVWSKGWNGDLTASVADDPASYVLISPRQASGIHGDAPQVLLSSGWSLEPSRGGRVVAQVVDAMGLTNASALTIGGGDRARETSEAVERGVDVRDTVLGRTLDEACAHLQRTPVDWSLAGGLHSRVTAQLAPDAALPSSTDTASSLLTLARQMPDLIVSSPPTRTPLSRFGNAPSTHGDFVVAAAVRNGQMVDGAGMPLSAEALAHQVVGADTFPKRTRVVLLTDADAPEAAPTLARLLRHLQVPVLARDGASNVDDPRAWRLHTGEDAVVPAGEGETADVVLGYGNSKVAYAINTPSGAPKVVTVLRDSRPAEALDQEKAVLEALRGEGVPVLDLEQGRYLGRPAVFSDRYATSYKSLMKAIEGQPRDVVAERAMLTLLRHAGIPITPETAASITHVHDSLIARSIDITDFDMFLGKIGENGRPDGRAVVADPLRWRRAIPVGPHLDDLPWLSGVVRNAARETGGGEPTAERIELGDLADVTPSEDGRSVILTDAAGQTAQAVLLGGRHAPPTDPNDILMPNGVKHGQHFEALRDPSDGTLVIMPRIRGGAVDEDPETQARPPLSGPLKALYETTLAPDAYGRLLADTRASLQPANGITPARSDFVDALRTRIEPVLQTEPAQPRGETGKRRTVEGEGEQHDAAVRYIVNSALLVARASVSDGELHTAPLIRTHAQALDYVVGIRTLNVRNSKSLALRDADHYLSNLVQEWQIPLERSGVGQDRTPSTRLARLSGMVSRAYDLAKARGRADSTQDLPLDADISLMEPHDIAASAPGGRAWAALGTRDFLRMSKQAGAPNVEWMLTDAPGSTLSI
ncbi:NUDIX domain-containing protein [Trinickia sp. NRRL B-1857]|uniref:NUDIX domain-containing protein n=1 Tax=Trinickia sp. NRRL B-1857 TaxID=3162879 RepID=UPI003D2B4201